jgi:hypothetical protein
MNKNHLKMFVIVVVNDKKESFSSSCRAALNSEIINPICVKKRTPFSPHPFADVSPLILQLY